MEFLIRTAVKSDYSEIKLLTSKVWGNSDFIFTEFLSRIADEKHNHVIVGIDNSTQKIIAIAFMKFYLDYCWLEGLRIIPDYRGLKIATKIGEYLYFKATTDKFHTIGLSTGIENKPIQKLASDYHFSPVAEQVLLFPKQLANSTVLFKTFSSPNPERILEFVRKSYGKVFYSYKLLPNNKKGDKEFKNINIYETEYSIIISPKSKVERPIFTIYRKNTYNETILVIELDKINAIRIGHKIENYGIGIPKQDFLVIKTDEIAKKYFFSGTIFYEKYFTF